MEAVLQFDRVTFGYDRGGRRVEVLRDASISFDKGVFYTVVGPSGSGKTTSLALAGALDVPQRGRILYGGQDIRKIGLERYRKKNVALIFQNYNLINYLTALENVVLAMEIGGTHRGERRRRAAELLREVGLSDDEMRRNVMKLSGGQQQRVAIARALASDADTARDMVSVFKELAHAYHKCVIVVTHSQQVSAESDVMLRFAHGTLQAA